MEDPAFTVFTAGSCMWLLMFRRNRFPHYSGWCLEDGYWYFGEAYFSILRIEFCESPPTFRRNLLPLASGKGSPKLLTILHGVTTHKTTLQNFITVKKFRSIQMGAILRLSALRCNANWQSRIQGSANGAVASGPPQNRNRIHGFYCNICFSELTKK
jgi:hypothetical protein